MDLLDLVRLFLPEIDLLETEGLLATTQEEEQLLADAQVLTLEFQDQALLLPLAKFLAQHIVHLLEELTVLVLVQHIPRTAQYAQLPIVLQHPTDHHTHLTAPRTLLEDTVLHMVWEDLEEDMEAVEDATMPLEVMSLQSLILLLLLLLICLLLSLLLLSELFYLLFCLLFSLFF